MCANARAAPPATAQDGSHHDVAAAPVEYALLGTILLAGGQSHGYALPMAAEEAVALQKPNPHRASRTLWRVRPPGSLLRGSPLLIEGIDSLWPWPGLAPDEIAPLMALRERLGLDPPPSANPSAGDAGAGELG
jgi:hypothetical protein